MPDEATARVTERTRSAALTVTLKDDADPVADVALVAEAFDSITVGSVRAALMVWTERDDVLGRARTAILKAADRDKAYRRFHPDFPMTLRYPEARVQKLYPFSPIDFDPLDPMDAALQVGVNSWTRRAILASDSKLYRDLFSFARLQRATKRSPLLLEMGVLFGVVALPVVLVFGILGAVSSVRRRAAEADIRETEAELKREELRQRRIQTEIYEHIRDSVKQLADHSQLHVPDEALAAAATITSPAVGDLSSSPLIDNVTVGFSS